MNIQDFLKTFQLTAKEQMVFLVCLKLGDTAIMPIVRETKLPRTSLVYTLERLQHTGLVQVIKKNGRKLYVPTQPRKLVTLLRQKQASVESQIELLNEALPELNQLYGSKKVETRVRIYQGQEEVRQVYEEILIAPVNDTWYVGDATQIRDALGDRYLKQWIRRRVAKKIHARAIRIAGGELYDPEYSGTGDVLRSIRFAPKGFMSPANIVIYGDTVLVLTTAKESLGLTITSRDFATTMKNWFKALWRISSEKPD